MNRTDGLFPVSLLLLAGCGAGTAGLVAGGGGDSGGSSNALPVLSNFTVESPEVSPARVHFVLSDREGDPARVALAFSVGTKSAQLLTHIEGIAANPTQLASSEDGVVYDIPWHFTEEDGLSKDGSFVDGVRVTAVLENGVQELVLGANGDFGLGNDPPEIESALVPPIEVDGTVGIAFVVSDTSDDIVRIRIEYDIVGDEPDLGWQPARPALDGSTPDYAFEGIVADREGTPLEFFWDTDFDLAELEHDVQLRLTAFDSIVNGASFETTSFHVDNNAEPIAVMHGDLLVTSTDQRRGILVPFTVNDDEGDDVEVVLQWRRAEEEFPELPSTPAEIREVLANPDQSRALHVCSEYPRPVTGIVERITSTTVELPELASSASPLLASDLGGRRIDFLRAWKQPESITEAWSQNPLRSPIAVLPLGDGLRAVVIDAPATNAWRAIEIGLADGRVSRLLTTGTGTPSVAALERGRDSILVASTIAFTWHVDRIDLASGTLTPLITQSGPNHGGRLRGLASLGKNAALATVGDKLVQLDWTDPAEPRATTLRAGLATPWGVVLDPLREGYVYLAEHDGPQKGGIGRVLSVDRRTYAIEEIVTTIPGEFGPGLPSPRELALTRDGTRLLALCDVDPQFGRFELRGVELGAAALNAVYSITDDVDAGTRGLATGADDLVLLAQTNTDELLAGGGVEQRRTIAGVDVSKRRVTVDEPFDPPLRRGTTWRILNSFERSRPANGTARAFAWNSADLPSGGKVLLRATPFDSEVGTESVSIAEKVVRAPIDRDDVTSVGGDFHYSPSSVAVSDLDRDGDLDLVATGTDLSIYWQTRPREFSPQPTQVAVPTSIFQGPLYAHAADVDGDGGVDLACGYSSSSGAKVVVYWRVGEREFDPEPTVVFQNPTPFASLQSRLADMDGDGRGDFVIANYTGHAMSICWQSKPRTFETTTLGGVSAQMAPVVIELGDFDTDGDLDIVTELGGGLTVFWQLDRRVFGPPTQIADGASSAGFLDVADIDGDGDFDIAQGGGIFWHESATEFGPVPTIMSSAPGLEFGDVDGDEDLDAVGVSTSTGSASILWQYGPGLFDATALNVGETPTLDKSTPFQTMRDVDGDGRQDLVLGGGSHARVKVLWQSNDRNIDAAAVLLGSPATLPAPYLLSAADLDGDGDLDLASGSLSNDSLRVWSQTSPGRFGALPRVYSVPELGSLCASDIDGDGKVDLAVTGGVSSMAVYWQGEPGEFDGQPTQWTSSQFLFRPISLQAADIDGDGDVDLAFANSGLHKLGVYWQTAPRVFSSSPTLMPPNFSLQVEDPRAVCIVDVDLDGDRDLVSANAFAIAIFRQTTPGVFQSNPTVIQGHFPSTNQPVAIAAADIDGDGDVDIASANYGENSSGTLTLFRRTGANSFDPEPLVLGGFWGSEPGGGFDPHALRVADMDHDGDMDLACTTDRTDHPVRVYWQLSPWRFDPISTRFGNPVSGDNPYALEVADLDGDGDPDLASANLTSESISIFWGSR